jgi:protein TonB
MKSLRKVAGAATKVSGKRAAKKQINISWNSRIFFQVGLIVSLLAVFFVMELEIGKVPNVAVSRDVLWETLPNIEYTLIMDVAETPKEQPKKRTNREVVNAIAPIVSQIFVAVDTDKNIIEGKIATSDTQVIDSTLVSKGKDTFTPPTTTSILGVEQVPVFPGCESAVGNSAKIECMSSKIRSFIGKRFEVGKFDYFEPGTVQTIHTVFTIDTYGNIVEIKARAKDKNLEMEAKRVIGKLPLMQPGRQGETLVNVSYSMPIYFQVNK